MITLLQFPDEFEFRLALTEKGITGAAQEMLVCDEARNREHLTKQANMISQVQSAVCCYIVMAFSGPKLKAQDLPAPDELETLARMILVAELYTADGPRHPALSDLAGDRNSTEAAEWNRAILGVLNLGKANGLLTLRPRPEGTTLTALTRNGILDVPPFGNALLPRKSVVALAVEALHRLTGTQRRHGLPHMELPGISFSGCISDWSKLLDPIFDAASNVPLVMPNTSASGSTEPVK